MTSGDDDETYLLIFDDPLRLVICENIGLSFHKKSSVIALNLLSAGVPPQTSLIELSANSMLLSRIS